MLQKFLDPVYAYRPIQAIRRFKYLYRREEEIEKVTLPWGGQLDVLGKEKNGRAILHRGLMELVVTEACFRLAKPGTVAVDAGANVGHMTSALAHTMQEGTIWAFEPHPLLFSMLVRNYSHWKNEVPSVSIKTCQIALSSEKGTAEMHVPDQWDSNAGIASLEKKRGESIEVSTRCLDDEIADPIHLLKLDVEGHEAAVLRGAESHLERGAIRHIIFEDHQGGDSDVTSSLQSSGYQVFGIRRHLAGPTLTDCTPKGAYNFIATLHPDYCFSAFKRRGWRSLQ
jgi:FkbM family methyltransferase